MKQVKRTYTDFDMFVKNEPELVKSLIDMCIDNVFDKESIKDLEDKIFIWNWRENRYEPMTELSDIIEWIQEVGDSEEDVDSLYITKTYSMDTYDGKFTLEAYGSSYRKDQSICDEKMSDEIVVIDNEAIKIQAEAEKVIKAEKRKIENSEKWKNFIKEMQEIYVDSDEILEELSKNYSFPSKII